MEEDNTESPIVEEEDCQEFTELLVQTLINCTAQLVQEAIAQIMYKDKENPRTWLELEIKQRTAHDPTFKSKYLQTLAKAPAILMEHDTEIQNSVIEVMDQIFDMFGFEL